MKLLLGATILLDFLSVNLGDFHVLKIAGPLCFLASWDHPLFKNLNNQNEISRINSLKNSDSHNYEALIVVSKIQTNDLTNLYRR